MILESENVRPFSWESIHRLRVAPPADEERRLYGREEGGVWDSEGGGDRGRQQTEDIRKKLSLNHIMALLYI